MNGKKLFHEIRVYNKPNPNKIDFKCHKNIYIHTYTRTHTYSIVLYLFKYVGYVSCIWQTNCMVKSGGEVEDAGNNLLRIFYTHTYTHTHTHR